MSFFIYIHQSFTILSSTQHSFQLFLITLCFVGCTFDPPLFHYMGDRLFKQVKLYFIPDIVQSLLSIENLWWWFSILYTAPSPPTPRPVEGDTRCKYQNRHEPSCFDVCFYLWRPVSLRSLRNSSDKLGSLLTPTFRFLCLSFDSNLRREGTTVKTTFTLTEPQRRDLNRENVITSQTRTHVGTSLHQLTYI